MARPALDPTLIKAIGHPLRYEILSRLNDDVASPAELARALDQPLGRVSYHVRTLARLGAIELVRTEPRRGAVEHYYRARMRAWLNDDEWNALPAAARRPVVDRLLRRVLVDLADGARAGGFDHPLAHLSYTRLALDPDALADVAEVLDKALRRVIEIERAAAARRGADDAAWQGTELVLAHFASPADA